MENKFKKAFGDAGHYVCAGDTITAEVDGFAVTARIVHDDTRDKPDERDEALAFARECVKQIAA